MKSYIKRIVHQILLPRGKQFVLDAQCVVGWETEQVENNGRVIQILYKYLPQATQTVILAHPYLGDARQFFQKRGYTDIYLEMCCNVVLFDFNGFGESPFVDFSYDKDLALVVTFCKDKFSETKLIGHGISFGGSHTVTYATYDDHKMDKFIIENILDSNLSYYRKRSKTLYNMMRLLMKLSSRINADHDHIKAASKMQHHGALFIYNDEDDLTTLDMGIKIMEKCPEPKKMVIFNGKHLEAYSKNTEKYKKTIREFIYNEDFFE